MTIAIAPVTAMPLPSPWLLACLALCCKPILAEEAPAPGHTREEETARIRAHHLKRLEDRLNTEAKVLHEECRYESEVSTRPPAKRVVLTFDDGPEPGQTEFILDTLRRRGIKAAFFLIGHKARQHPELVAQIKAAGHHLTANHSWSHPNFHDISIAEQAGEVLKGDDLASTGPLKLFRYPYGNASCATNALLHARGYRIVGWHVDSCDWAFDRSGSVDQKEALSCGVLPHNRSDFVDHVVSSAHAHNGGIILMHEIHPNTLQKLDGIIGRLLDDGFTFGSLDEPEFATSLR